MFCADRVVEARRHRAGADVELAHAERPDHLRRIGHLGELDIEPFVAEIALLEREEEADVARDAGGGDLHGARSVCATAGARGPQQPSAATSASNDRDPTCHCDPPELASHAALHARVHAGAHVCGMIRAARQCGNGVDASIGETNSMLNPEPRAASGDRTSGSRTSATSSTMPIDRRARPHRRRRLEPGDRRAGRDLRAFQSGPRAGRAVRQDQGLSARHADRLRPAQHLPAARLFVRLPGHRRPDRAGEGLSRPHEERFPADPAGGGEGRADPRKHRPRRRRRPVQVPGADDPREGRRPLHRHLLRRDHARSRHRLGQSRHLSRGGARPQHRRASGFRPASTAG